MLAAAGRSGLENRRMKKIKLFASVIAAAAICAYVATGLRYASYAPQRSDTSIWGVSLVHSTMSDGLQPPDEIAVQARATGVSLVLLKDHGRPNLASSS